MKKAAVILGAAAFVIVAVLFVLDVVFSEGVVGVTSGCEFHFIDVGQGDCTMLVTDDACIVVDTGPAARAGETAAYIRDYADEIDYLILTHPHEDHVGGASEIINDIKTDNVIMTDAFSDTFTFTKLLTTIEDSGVTVTEADAGSAFSAGGISVRILAPLQDFDDYNNYSIVCKAVYGNTSALLMGDAEFASEKAMLGFYTGGELKSDIIKLAHHGSSTSSGYNFLSEVSPLHAIISCGKDNTYGHPHGATLKTLKKLSIPYYRTDERGSVVFSSDGESVKLISR